MFGIYWRLNKAVVSGNLTFKELRVLIQIVLVAGYIQFLDCHDRERERERERERDREVRDGMLKVCWRDVINRLWKFHQSYNFSAVGTKMNWLHFEAKGQKSVSQLDQMHFFGGEIPIDGQSLKIV